ncbi:MAG: sensor histidine kinase [Actinomycetota bacterium]
MKSGSVDERGRHIGLRWIGLGLWLALLAGSAIIARAAGATSSALPYVTAAALAAVGVVGLVAYARLSSAPPQLRTLRILAVLLPTLFIVCLEAILLIVEADELFTEVGEHIFATALLSLCAIPFSVWIFRSFAALRDEIARRAARLERLHRASLAVTGEPSMPRLHEAILRGARDVADADRAVLLIAARDGPEIILSDPTSPEPGETERAMLGMAGSGGADRTFLTTRTRGRAPHALLVRRSVGPPFVPEEGLVLDMFGVAAAAGLENAERLEEAQRLATVEERERIARDLHDDLGQLLGYLTTKIQASRELVATGRSDAAAEELGDLEDATRSLSAQVREAILGLRTSVGPDRPLGLAIEEYTAEFGIQAGLRTTFSGSVKAGGTLVSPARYQVMRIAQEAMSNARRHAAATSVAVALDEHDGAFELSVSDDGSGFDPAAAARTGRFGLTTMAERARAVGGSLDVRSVVGEGTVVTLSVPIRPAGG